MRTGNKDRHQQIPPLAEEPSQLVMIIGVEHCKSRKRASHTTIKGRRNSPDSSLAVTQLFLLRFTELLQPVRRIGNHRVQLGLLSGPHHFLVPPQPSETILVVNAVMWTGSCGWGPPTMFREQIS